MAGGGLCILTDSPFRSMRTLVPLPVLDFATKALDKRGDCAPFESGWCRFSKYGGQYPTLFGIHGGMVLLNGTFVKSRISAKGGQSENVQGSRCLADGTGVHNFAK